MNFKWKLDAEFKGNELISNLTTNDLVESIGKHQVKVIYFLYSILHEYVVPEYGFLIIIQKSKPVFDNLSQINNAAIFYPQEEEEFFELLFEKMKVLHKLVSTSIEFRYNLKGTIDLGVRTCTFIDLSSRLYAPFCQDLIQFGSNRNLYTVDEIESKMSIWCEKICHEWDQTFLVSYQSLKSFLGIENSFIAWVVLLVLDLNAALKPVGNSFDGSNLYLISIERVEMIRVGFLEFSSNVMDLTHDKINSKLELKLGESNTTKNIKRKWDESNEDGLQPKINQTKETNKAKLPISEAKKQFENFLLKNYPNHHPPKYEHYAYKDLIGAEDIFKYKGKIIACELVFQGSKISTSIQDAVDDTVLFALDYFQNQLDEESRQETPKNNNQNDIITRNSPKIEIIKLNTKNSKEQLDYLVGGLRTSYKRLRKIELPQLIKNCSPSILSVHNSELTTHWVARINLFNNSFQSENPKRKAAETEVINQFIIHFKNINGYTKGLTQSGDEVNIVENFLSSLDARSEFNQEDSEVGIIASLSLFLENELVGTFKAIHFNSVYAKAAVYRLVLDKFTSGEIVSS